MAKARVDRIAAGLPPSGWASRALRAFRRLGPGGFVKLAAYNMRLLLSGRAGEHSYAYDDAWDRLHGVSTAGTLEVCELDGPEEVKATATRYEPTPPDCFAFLIERATTRDRSRFTFVDLGSGKGRVAMLASLAGFRKVIAVEFAADLHAAAARNFESFAAGKERAPIAALLADARSYQWEAEPTLCFLNNPFSADVLDEVLRRIERSLSDHPREFVVVYYHSDHAQLFERSGWRRIDQGYWQNKRHHYAIFSWVGAG